MSKKTWIIIILLLAGVFGFFLFGGQSEEVKKEVNPKAAEPKVVVADDHIAGTKGQKTVLIEYLDFQCPACKNLFPTMQQLRQKYGDKVTFVVRHFPLTNIHPNGLAASRAAEAAAAQGKFFEMEEKLFTTQETWGRMSAGEAQKSFEAYAQQLGLDEEKFRNDFAHSATLTRINRDRDSGAKLGAQSTPSLFLNGKKLELTTQSDVEKALEEATRQ